MRRFSYIQNSISLLASLKEVLFLYPKSKVTHRAINARQVPCGHALS
nr:MAG TPA: hypothetical protein [Caudoviricetes sp.]